MTVAYHSVVHQAVPAIGIFCHDLTKGGNPFRTDVSWQAYQELLLAIAARGAQAYLLTDNNTYSGCDGMFDVAYAIDGATPLDALRAVHDVHIDLVFNCGRFIGRDITVVSFAKQAELVSAGPEAETEQSIEKLSVYLVNEAASVLAGVRS